MYLIIPFAQDLIDSPPAAVMFRISFGLAGIICMFCAIASDILYEESVHAESSTTPSMAFVIAAARFFLFSLVFVLFEVDSQLGLIMLSALVILVLLLGLLINKLFKLLEIRLFLVISIMELKLSINFLNSVLIFVLFV